MISVYVKALDGNPEYRSALAAYDQVAEAKPQALAKLLPQIGASAGYDAVQQSISGRYFVGTLSDSSPGFDINREDTFNNFGYAVGLSQVLFREDLFIGLDEAELQVGRASLQTYEAQNQLRIAVAEAYFAALQADDEVRFATAEKQAVAQVLAQTRDKAGSGIVAETELKTAQAQYDLAAAGLIAAKNAVEVSRAQLELLTGGQKPGLLKTLAKTYLPQPPEPNNIGEWSERAKTQNLEVQAQRLSTQIAKKELDRAYSRRWPTLDALAARTYAFADGGLSKGIGANNNHESDTRVSVKLQIPIFTGGAVSSAIRAATAGVVRAEADENARRGMALRRVQVAFLNSNAGIAKVEALKQAVVSTTAAEDAVRVGNEVGTKTGAELLLAVGSRYRAERDYAAARYDHVLNTLRLRAAAGSLSHADLLAINRVLQ
ncbi:MAG: efflux transporter outer membrane subunit OpmH [Nevskia sp.]